MEIIKQVVKIKKLQMLGDNLAILIPKGWTDELDWTRETRLVLEFLPHRKMMVLSQKIATSEKLAPIYTKEGEKQRDAKREELSKEELEAEMKTIDEIEAEAQSAADEIMIPETFPETFPHEKESNIESV